MSKRKFIPTASALDAVPAPDRAELAALPAKQHQLVLTRLDWVLKIEAVAKTERRAYVRSAAKAMGVKENAVYRLCRKYREGGWKAMQDGRGGLNGGTPPAFQDFVKMLHLSHQRSTTGREVHRVLMERWSLWKQTGDPRHAIPGYRTPPRATFRGYPSGWSLAQIYRMRPDEYALTAMRQGAKAASEFLPSVLKTRVGLKFGQVVFFDDQDLDLKVAPRGSSKRPLRPQGFASLDYLSGCFLDQSMRLRWWDEDKNKYRTLTSIEATWFQIAHLQKIGYRPDTGTTLVEEHGTMKGFANKDLTTLSGHHSLADALYDFTGGKVRTEASGRFNSPAFAGLLFRPQSAGNFKFKAPLESLFNLVRNRMSALPGAMGRNKDLKPEEQYGLDAYTSQLLKLYDRLDESHRKLIKFLHLTPEQLGAVADAVYSTINNRTDHQLEGWAKLGFVTTLFRFAHDSEWLTQEQLLALPDPEQRAAQLLAERPGHLTTRALSPAEVASAHMGELTKLPDHAIPLLIPVEWSKEATVRSDRTIKLQDNLLGPEPFIYPVLFRDRSAPTDIRPGSRLRCYQNPHDTSKLVVCRMDGSFLGCLHERTRAGFFDTDSIEAQLRQNAAMKADMDVEVRPLVEPLMQHRKEVKDHNDRLAQGKPVTEEEKASARSEAAKKGQRTAAANRLQRTGTDHAPDLVDEWPPSPTPSAFDELPDDEELPEGF